MAYSYDSYTGDGTTDTFSVTFGYIQKSDVDVKVDGGSVSFTWPTDATVKCDTPPANGTTVLIIRTTQKTSRLVDFTIGAVLDEATLDKDSNQLFYVAQEAFDDLSNAMQFDAATDEFDANNKRIKDVSDPTAAQDAATKNWAETAMSSQLSQAITAKTGAETAQTGAETAEAKAEKWAEEDHDVEVEAGKYSALHWATEAINNYGSSTFGIDDNTAGQITLYGPGTGGTAGGTIVLHTGADYDDTIDYFNIKVTEDDLNIGPSSDPNALMYVGATNYWEFTNGAVTIGVDDATPGLLRLYGDGTSSVDGGGTFTYTAADHDGTIDYYNFRVYQDDLHIGPDTDPDALKYTGGSDYWEFTNGAVTIGVEDDTYGFLRLYGDGAASVSGGGLFAYTAADHDGTIEYYNFKVYEDDLRIGPNTNSDALKYNGTDGYWEFTSGVVIVGVEDDTSGFLRLYGDGTSSVNGGGLFAYTAADHDGTIDYYNFRAYEDDLYIGPNTNTNALSYNGAGNRWDADTHFYPKVDSSFTLGGASYCWSNIYGDAGVTSCSDSKYKKDRQQETLGLEFINELVPVAYKFRTDGKRPKSHKRVYHGLIADEVEAVLSNLGYAYEDFAGLEESYDDGGDRWLGLKYEQFISPLIKAVQELAAKVDRLEKKAA